MVSSHILGEVLSRRGEAPNSQSTASTQLLRGTHSAAGPLEPDVDGRRCKTSRSSRASRSPSCCLASAR
eukprot:64712-Pyramimonas_sp.AAC.1